MVLATGADNDPHVPDWPGRADFSSPLIHSSAYRSPAPYASSTVLVVGSDNSGTEVAVDLASAGDVTVELAVRTPPNILLQDARGVPTQPLGIALQHLPPAVVDPLVTALRRLTLPDLTAHGLPAPRQPYSQFCRTGTVPVLDHGFVAGVLAGRIRIRPGVVRLDGAEVEHSDGTRSRPDAVIAATGYGSGLEPVLGPSTCSTSAPSHHRLARWHGRVARPPCRGPRDPAVGLPARDRPGHRTGSQPRWPTTVLTEATSQMAIEVPRDWDGSFEPQMVEERQRRLTGGSPTGWWRRWPSARQQKPRDEDRRKHRSRYRPRAGPL